MTRQGSSGLWMGSLVGLLIQGGEGSDLGDGVAFPIAV